MTLIRATPGRVDGMIRTRIDRIERGVARALMLTARDAVPMIRKRAPIAFGPLRASVDDRPVLTHYRGKNTGPIVHARTVVDSPYAGAVERGSPPHKPNFERLLAWVKLRGMQGLTARGNLRSRFPAKMGPTTPFHARNVAKRLKQMVVRKSRGNKRQKRDANGRYLPTDAAVRVTQAISSAIEKRGTRPHFFVRNSLIEIAATMGRRVRTAVRSAD